MPEWDEFTKLATGGSFDQVVRWMDTHNSKLVFDATFALAANQPAAFKGLWDSVPYAGDKISDFALDFIYGGYMPQKPYSLMDWIDYDNAREVYLRSFEKTKRPPAWPTDRHINSKLVSFYPEYGWWRTRRASVIQLAIDHCDLGPGNRFQANLFCLGGRYTFSIGMQGAHPSGPGTTCMLFARSILHAAGINVIGSATPTSCSCDKGLNAELKHLGCYVDTKSSTNMPTPNPGDIFHIEGPPFKGGYGSAHVGIIISIAGNKWTCIQGGASNHVTKRVTYTVKPTTNKTWGNWCFEEDYASVKMVRGIRGYWNIDNIGTGHYMTWGMPQPGIF
jgi:hypothetical protein